MNEYHPEKLYNRFFITTLMIAFFLSVEQACFTTTVTAFAVARGFSNAFGGTMSLSFSLVSIIARPVSAYISDFKSKRLCIILGCILYLIGSILFTIPFISSAAAFLLIRCVQGFGYAAGTTAYYSACVDVTPKGKRDLALGFSSAGQGAAQLLASIAVTVLVVGSGYVRLYLFAALTGAVALIFGITCTYEKKYPIVRTAPKEKYKIRFFDVVAKESLPGAAICFVYFAAVSAGMFFAYPAALAKGIENGAMFFSVSAFSAVVCNISVSKATQRFGRIRTFALLCLLLATGLFLMAFTSSFSALIAAGLLYGAAMAALPLIMGSCVQNLPANRRGSGTSTFYLAMDLSMGFGPVLWGFIIDITGFKTVFVLTGAMALVSIVLGRFTLLDKVE